MSQEPEQNLGAARSAELQPTGEWFRRERERIAIGRKPVAEKLGVAERQIALLETKKQPVPAAWLPRILELGFRLEPAEATAAPESKKSPVAAPPASAPVAESAPVETAAPAAETARPAAETATPAAEPPPAGGLLGGTWLRSRRHAQILSMRSLTDTLGVSENDLYTMESHNLPLPIEWFPVLSRIGILPAEEQGAAVAAHSAARPDGKWLQAMRHRHKLTTKDLAARLRTTYGAIQVVEARRWPVPDGWLAVLKELPGGLMQAPVSPPDSREPNASSESAAMTERRERPASATTFGKAAKETPSVEQPALSGGVAAPVLTGAWLREQREAIGVSQRDLGHYVGVEQWQVSRCERWNQRVPTSWLPLLSTLGMLSGEAAASLSAAAANPSPKRGVGRPRKHPLPATDAATGETSPLAPLTGRWVRAERDRLGLRRSTIAEQLGLRRTSVTRLENGGESVPPRWLPILTRLGFQLPSGYSAAAVPERRKPGRPRRSPLPGAATDFVPTAGRGALVAEVIAYRLKLARHAGTPAVETLALLAQDLRLAGGANVVSLDALAAAMQVLLGHR